MIETSPMDDRAMTTEALFINGKRMGEMNYHGKKYYHAVIRLQFGNGIPDYALIQGFGEDRESAIKNAVAESLDHHQKCVRAIQDFDWEISREGEQ